MEKIKSTYIIHNIFNYIPNKNMKLKIFNYSKEYQQKLDIDLFDYQKISYDQRGFNLFIKNIFYQPFLHFFYNPFYDKDKNNIKTSFQKELLKYNINIDEFKNYAIKYCEEYKEQFLEINKMKIREKEEEYAKGEDYTFIIFNNGVKLVNDIYSPFFDIIYNSKNLEELFIIRIDSETIEEYQLENDYISAFNKLNSINSNYSSILFIFKEDKDINYLKNFNIKFNQIKNLKIIRRPKRCEINSNRKSFDILFKDLFYLKNIENSIIDLNITINYYNIFEKKVEIDEGELENLNKFKVLENLTLQGFDSKNIFELKINTLKSLYIIDCKNIYINGDKDLSLKKLKLVISSNENISRSLLKLPQLKYFELYTENEDLSIDFKSLTNLKKLYTKSLTFLKFNNSSLLEYVNISDNINMECLKKIISMTTLKEIDICSILNDEDFGDSPLQGDIISNISGKNNNISKLTVRYRGFDISEDLINKFPNLNDLTIWAYNFDNYEYGKINLEINENPNCKINKINLNITTRNMNLYCQSFENLKEIKIKVNPHENFQFDILNIANSLPMFSNKKINYNSLIEFNLQIGEQLINLEEFKNLINNIDNMQNLKKFIIYAKFDDNIDNNLYEDFIKKILSLNIEFIKIEMYGLNKEYYSFEELKKINKNIIFKNFEIINIPKIKKE